MTTALDTSLGPEIMALINEFGKTVTFQSEGTSVDVATGSVTGGGISTATKVTPPEPLEDRFALGDVFKVGDMVSYVAVGIVVPSPGMTMTFDTEIWTIVAVGRLYTGDLIGAYKLVLRK